MTVTIPATVTNLASAFYGCTNLTEVTLEHTHSALVDGTVTMTNAFQGCTSLATVHCHNAPTINEDGNWHAYRITSNGSVNVYNGEELNDWNDSETPVSLSGNIVATKKTNLVSFGDFTDAQVKDVMDYGKSFTSKSALVPNAKNFVMWGAPNTNFQTNLPLGGGGSVTYPEGYVYQQLYFPAVTIGGKTYSAGWGKTPIELGMTPASGYKWEEFTKAFTDAGKQYLKIMSNASQIGHNAYHRHSINMLMYAEGSSNLGYSVGWNYRRYQPDEILTDYEGNPAEQTVEVNASGMKIWKVVADT